METQRLLSRIMTVVCMAFFMLRTASASNGGQPVLQSQQKEPVFQHLTIDDGLSDNSVNHVLQDRLGFIWATTVQGINKYDGMTFTTFLPQVQGSSQSTPQCYQTMLEDRDGILWVSTFGGLSRFDPATEQFTNYRNDPNNPNSLGYDILSQVTQDAGGMLWIGTYGGGLEKFDPASGVFTHYRHDPDSGRFDQYFHDENDATSLSHNMILQVKRDSRGQLWISTSGGGINRFDGQRFISYRNDPHNPDSLSTDTTPNFSEDRSGALWFATFGGINVYDPGGQRFTRYPGDPHNPDSIASNNLTCVMVAADGMLWTGGDGSIGRFDPATGKAVNFTPEQHGLSSLTSDQIYRDRQGTIWVATDSGVNRYDPGSNRFTPYPDVRAVLADDTQGTLWVIAGTNLARFDPDTGSLCRYDEYDGLLSNALEPTAGHASPSGEIFVGEARGFNSFFPDQLPDNPTPPPVVLTAFELLDKPVPVGGNSLLQQHINVTRRITLPYDYTALTLRFAALNYRSPQKNQYAYMLEGFDQDWIDTDSTHRFATYNDLSPGRYRFRVKASNNDGVWNEANMSHELRTPLNSVLGFSQVMKNSPDVTMGQIENLNIIIRSGEHLLNLINNVLDISKIESGRVELEESHIDLNQVLEDIKSMMDVRASEKGLDFTLEQFPDLPRHVAVDGGKLRQILLNLIGNALKYTTQGGVTVRIDDCQLTIDDWKKVAAPDQSSIVNRQSSIVNFQFKTPVPASGRKIRSGYFLPLCNWRTERPRRPGPAWGLP